MIVALVRHGRTAWNDAGRMQGRADVPLSEAGRLQVLGWRLPAALAAAHFVASPLARACETAALLGVQRVPVDAALIEMDWGAWEGETLEGLRALHGSAFAVQSARGLDFRPPGGESPRDVQQRITAWLVRSGDRRAPLVAVTHQGVIRAIMAWLTGWDMIGKAPVRLADDVVHVFDVGGNGVVNGVDWNLPLIAGPVGRRRARKEAGGDNDPQPRQVAPREPLPGE